MGNDSTSHLSPNFQFNMQIKLPKHKWRSQMGLLNTLQETARLGVRGHHHRHRPRLHRGEGGRRRSLLSHVHHRVAPEAVPFGVRLRRQGKVLR